MSKKKKVFILVGMVALLVLTGCLNYFLNRPAQNANAGTGDTNSATDFFTSSRAERVAVRAEERAYYDAIIADATSTEADVAEAKDKRDALVSAMETELLVESLIKALGFEDVIVTMSTENVNIILKTDEMTDAEVAQVLDVIVTETDKTASNVRLIPIE